MQARGRQWSEEGANIPKIPLVVIFLCTGFSFFFGKKGVLEGTNCKSETENMHITYLIVKVVNHTEISS